MTDITHLPPFDTEPVLDTRSRDIAVAGQWRLFWLKFKKHKIALVSLVGRDKQVFKARVGLDVCETSRDVSFCTHAIVQPNEVFVVPDARKDPRFADNPLVTGAPFNPVHWLL